VLAQEGIALEMLAFPPKWLVRRWLRLVLTFFLDDGLLHEVFFNFGQFGFVFKYDVSGSGIL
jgi:hypothetical protein